MFKSLEKAAAAHSTVTLTRVVIVKLTTLKVVKLKLASVAVCLFHMAGFKG